LLTKLEKEKFDFENEKKKLYELKQVLEKEIDCMKEEKMTMEKEKCKLSEEVVRLKNLEGEKQELEDRHLLLTKNMDELKLSLENQVEDLQLSKKNLIDDVVSLQDQLSECKSELSEAKKEVQEVKSELVEVSVKANSSGVVDNLRSKVDSLETEKKSLEKRLADLKVEGASTQFNSSDSNNVESKMKEDKEQLEGQVNFLNSVIVDMQRKNEDLKTRLEAMEMGNISDDAKANINGINTGRVAVAPRLYCDICDCFDLHDTEECPKQESSDSPPPTQNHGERGTIREYCDNCEMFGHDTSECVEEETF